MRTWTLLLIGVVLVGLWGCESQTTPVASRMETVSLAIPFQETYADTEGAKRVVVTELREKRTQTAFVGEVKTTGGDVVRKYTVRGNPTWVLPKVLGGYLKRVALNVSFAPRLETYDGDIIRETLSKFEADYLVAGQLEKLELSVLSTKGRPVVALVRLRLDVYSKQGRLRMYYPAPLRNAGFLGASADDPAAVSAFLNATITELFDQAFESSYFVEALDMDVATVRELMKANPVPPAPEPIPVKKEEPKPEPVKPVEPKVEPPVEPTPEPKVEPPVEPKPKELTEEEKAAIERARKARELEEAVKEIEENK